MKWINGSLYDSNNKLIGRVYSPDGYGLKWSAQKWGGWLKSGFESEEEAMQYLEDNV